MNQASKLLHGLKKSEKRAIVVCLLGILACIGVLNFYDFSGDSEDRGGVQLGYLSGVNNDIRHKNASKVFWKSAKKNQAIRAGDKLFTGKHSTANILLKNNATIMLDENSLVEFKDFGSEKLPDFSSGSYRLSGSGKMRIAINGKIAEIEGGAGSEIIMSVDDEKNVKFITTGGEAMIHYNNQSMRVGSKSATLVNNRGQQQQKLSDAADGGKIYDYTLGLYDSYERDLKQMRHRAQAEGLVRSKVYLPMKNLDVTKGIQVEHANRADFTGGKRMPLSMFEKYLPEVYLGENYWRYSQGSEWSQTQSFTVKPRLLPNSRPSVEQQIMAASLVKGSAAVPFDVSVPFDANGYVVEYGPNPDFQKGSTQLYWSYQGSITLLFNAPGMYFARFRGVDKDLKLGEWSDNQKITVLDEAPLPAPLFSKRDYVIPVHTRAVFAWSKSQDADSYTVGVYDSKQNLIEKTTVGKNRYTYTFDEVGRYEVVARATNNQGRQSPASAPVYVRVEKAAPPIAEKPVYKEEPMQEPQPPMLVEEKPVEEPVEVPRKLSSDVDTSSEIHVFAPPHNKSYIKSNFIVGLSNIAFQSRVQSNTNEPAPTSNAVTLTGLYWYGNHGAEVLMQKNLASGDDSPVKADFMDLEARYKFRIAPMDFISLFRHFQWTAHAGYEMFRNSNSDFYVGKYSMITYGTAIDIPVFRRFLVSFQMTRGMGKSSEAKEMKGAELSYFLKKNWSLGVGYKIYLYQKDLVDTFPLFAPYREGYTDASFTMKYFF